MSSLNLILRILVAFGMPGLIIGGAYLIVHNSTMLGSLAIIGGIALIAILFVQNRSEKHPSTIKKQ